MGDFWTQYMLDDVMVALLFAHGFPGSFSLFQHLPLFYHPWLYWCIAPTVLKVYASVIPEEQHTAVGKQTGETAHVERWNNTLRQRLARFVRMTLSFSKSEIMHEACLLLFLHRYNTERAILLK